MRATDIVTRFGGDEFVVPLVKSEKKSTALVAQKLQKQLLDTCHASFPGVPAG